MTTYIHTLKLDDSDPITLLDALSMLANTNERNVARARHLIKRINENIIQSSDNNFTLLPTKKSHNSM